MKLLFIPNIALGFCLIFGWGVKTDLLASHVNLEDTQQIQLSPLPIVQEMISQVSQERILTDLRRLSGEEPICLIGCYTITDRETGSIGLQWAKDYIQEELTNIGYTVEVQDWSRDGYTDQNLLVRKNGRIDLGKEIYFVAHLDGVPQSPAADDNASGAVSLLELARVIRSRSISYTVVMLFTTGEEHGALGSSSYVDGLTPEQISAIQYVVDIDMVGYDSDDDGAMQLWPGEQPVDFVQLLSEVISTYQIDLVPQIYPGCA